MKILNQNIPEERYVEILLDDACTDLYSFLEEYYKKLINYYFEYTG